MQLGFVGLGKMGKNMVSHLREQGLEVIAYNRTPNELSNVTTIADLVNKLSAPRVIWIMVYAGAPIDELITSLQTSGLQKGDTIIDGGNSYYKDSVRRHDALAQRGINFIDCGVSGGLIGGRHGACLMIGGEKDVVEKLTWLWDALANSAGHTVAAPTSHDAAEVEPMSFSGLTRGSALTQVPDQVGDDKPDKIEYQAGWSYLGPSGAGHFVKMIHNGVEYGMDQAIAEGFAMLQKSPYQLDLAAVASLWNHGSIVRGHLLELLYQELVREPTLETYTGKIGGGETGKWAIETAKELGIAVKNIASAVDARTESQTKPNFASKVVSALRHAYGGHEEAT